MHIENKLATYSQKAKEKGTDIKKKTENRRPMQTDKELHIGVFEEQKQTKTIIRDLMKENIPNV